MTDLRNSKFYPIFKRLVEKGGMEEKDYQLEGIYWAINNERGTLPYNVRGGIIADEMGLGKTFQVISVLVCNFKLRTLIVLPPILIQQWVEQFVKITGHRPFIYHSKFVKLNAIDFDTLNQSPIVITTYGMLATTKKKPRNILHTIEWNRVIYDEAHHLKNRNTSIFKGAQMVQSEINWFITGTPIQNKINDLYSLCDLLRIPRSAYRDRENHPFLREKFIMRRTKQDVDICVPPVELNHVMIPARNKIEMAIADDLHSILPFYNKIKSKQIEHLENDSTDKENSEEELDYEFEKDAKQIWIETDDDERNSGKNTSFSLIPKTNLFEKIYKKNEDDNVLPAFLRARQLCIHPPLFQKFIQRNRHLISHRDFTIYTKAIQNTHKLDIISNLIDERKSNENKKIIFCYFKNEIDYIHQKLIAMNITTDVIDGRTGNRKKADILEKSPTVLLLQIQTSCEGLNLQDYSEVYFTSPHWNPAVESQAIARCHRIGQKKTVEVFKFISVIPSGVSIEQYIIGIQNKKRGYAALITDKAA